MARRDEESDSSGSERHDEPPASLNVNAASAKDNSRLKRGREGSLEPHSTEIVSQAPIATTKKNRLAPTSSSSVPTTGQPPSKPLDVNSSPNLDLSDSMHSTKSLQPGELLGKPEDRVDVDIPLKDGNEAGNVGEVRRKVAEMSYDEDHIAALEAGAAQAVVVGGEPNDEPDATGGEQGVAGSGEGDIEGLKRKVLDRSEGSFVADGEMTKKKKDTPSPAKSETGKNIGLPPADATSSSSDIAAPSAKKPQATFSSFSSAASPFAAARSASPFASTSTNTGAPAKPFTASGFGAFSSTSSPFGAKKTTSAAGDNNAGKEATTGETANEPLSTSRAGPSSFDDILQQDNRADQTEDRVQMTTKDVTTGEEDEETLYSARAKLFSMEPDGGWRERGVGALKLNVRRSDKRGARLVMRAEGVLRLILNVSLYVGMPCLEDGKHVRTTVFEEGERRFITFRTGSAKAATELANAIHDHIPLESVSAASSKSPDSQATDSDSAV